jgi:protein-S-isoprenylcysteine O-methyltransferase Ste14
VKLNLATLAVGVLVFGFALSRHPSTAPWTPWEMAGLALAVPAFLLLVLARIQLGRAFSVQAKASTLVTTGLYARIRHPIYVFGALVIVGFCVFAHRPWWLLIFVLLVPVQWLRVRKEEQVLLAKFGDAYREYKRRTWL